MIRRVASMPSSSGMRMSMRTTSGSRRPAMATASPPSEASPTTSRSSSASRIILNPARTSAWSSAIRMRTLTCLGYLREASSPALGWCTMSCLAPEREPGADAVAAAAAQPGVQLAAVERHALADAGERADDLAAVVADLDDDLVGAVFDAHVGAPRARVLERRAQRELDDAVGREVDARRQLADRALDHEMHLEARHPHAAHEAADAGQGRLRRQRRLVVLAAQHAAQPAQLGQRLAPGSLDGLQ